MDTFHLHTIATQLVAEGKGILAADESTGSMEKRLASINIPSTEEHRRRYRELLFTTPGAEQYISGVILFDETFRQSTRDGVPFPKLLASKGIIPGIKVDKGVKPLAVSPEEKITEGLDGLRERLQEYAGLGAKFTKWRAVIEINESTLPTSYAIQANAHALARFAALSQEAGLVPIVEPEVLMDGSHGLNRCFAVTEHVLKSVFCELSRQQVALEGMLLKPNMIIPGKKHAYQASSREIAEATVRCFLRVVPAAVPGIVFLSGGQSEEEATANLNAMNLPAIQTPWELSFSYGRALQGSALKAWMGSEENVAVAQSAYLKRAKLNGLARLGQYREEIERE